MHLLTAEVVEPFETLVVKARTKITFTVGVPTLFHSCDGFEGWNSSTWVDSDWCLYSHEERKQDSTRCFVQYYRVTYPP